MKSGPGTFLKLAPSEVANTILQSTKRCEKISSVNQIILLESARKCLSELGLSIGEDFFGSETTRLERASDFVPQIVSLFQTGRLHDTLHIDCLVLLEELVHLEQNSSIQKLIDCGGFPILIDRVSFRSAMPIIVRILLKILEGGIEEHAAAIIETEVVQALRWFLIETKLPLPIKNACKVLELLATKSLDLLHQALYTLAEYHSEYYEKREESPHRVCLDTFYHLCCDDRMPLINFSDISLEIENIRHLLSSKREKCVEYGCLELGAALRHGHCYSEEDNIRTFNLVVVLLLRDSSRLKELAFRLMGAMLKTKMIEYDTVMDLNLDADMTGCIKSLSFFLKSGSNGAVARSCRCIGFLLKKLLGSNIEVMHIACGEAFMQMIKALTELNVSYEYIGLTAHRQWLLLSIDDEDLPQATTLGDVSDWCLGLDAKFRDMRNKADGDFPMVDDIMSSTFNKLIDCAVNVRINKTPKEAIPAQWRLGDD